MGGGASNSTKTTYARQAQNPKLYAVERPMKFQNKEFPVIGFSDDENVGISLLHSDALVITLTIENHNVHRILVDNGSSANILY